MTKLYEYFGDIYGVKEVTNLPLWAAELPEALPHGSGVDCDWYIIGHKNHITCTNEYHCMDECGGYDGYAAFSVIIKPYKHTQPDGTLFEGLDVVVHFHGAESQYKNKKYMLREYLGDTIHNAIGDLVWGKGFPKFFRSSDIWRLEYLLKMAQDDIHPWVISGQPNFENLSAAMDHIGKARAMLER
jgi:hypothetical protein